MPIPDFLRQRATITAEAPAGSTPAPDALGGADRSDPNWTVLAADVPCLVSTKSSALDYRRNDARAGLVDARIYFAADPVPGGGLSSRCRVTVVRPGAGDTSIVGTYAVLGVTDPNSMGRLFAADCSRIRSQ